MERRGCKGDDRDGGMERGRRRVGGWKDRKEKRSSGVAGEALFCRVLWGACIKALHINTITKEEEKKKKKEERHEEI